MNVETTSTTLLRVLGEDARSARWVEFVARYVPLMTDFLRGRYPEIDSDDVVQETLIAVAKALPNYRYDPDEKGYFRNWLLGVVRNKANDVLRSRAHDASLLERLAEEKGVAADSGSSAEDWRRDAFEVALAQLLCDPGISERDRRVFRRVALNEEPPDEVAKLFGITRNHVDQIKSRLKARLRVLAEGLLHA